MFGGQPWSSECSHNTPATHATVTQSSGHLDIARVAGQRGACTPTDLSEGEEVRRGRLEMGRKGRLLSGY